MTEVTRLNDMLRYSNIPRRYEKGYRELITYDYMGFDEDNFKFRCQLTIDRGSIKCCGTLIDEVFDTKRKEVVLDVEQAYEIIKTDYEIEKNIQKARKIIFADLRKELGEI